MSRCSRAKVLSCRRVRRVPRCSGCFFFNYTATTEIYTLSLHDALPIFPYEPAHQPFGIGIQQELIVVEAMAAFGIVRAVNANAVELSRSQIGEITVPFLIRVLRQRDTGRLPLPLLVEQAQLDALGVLREDRDV